MTTEEKTKPVTDLFDQALKSYEQALKTGLKLQEESARFFTNLVSQTTSPQDWQKRMKSITDEFIPETQKAAEEGLKLMEQTSRTGMELVRKTVTAGQPASFPDAQAKFLALWEASLKAVRDTAVAVSQAQNKTMESWIACARGCGEPAAAGARG